jgi:anti-sigma factor RsiW
VRHVLDDLTAYLDGALPPERRAELEGHLAGCGVCRAERDRLAAGLAALATAPAPPAASPGFEARFHTRLAQERSRPRTLRQRLARLRWPVLAPLAGAAALAVAGGIFVRHRAEQSEMARHLGLLENYELVASLEGLADPEDVSVVTQLHELEKEKP